VKKPALVTVLLLLVSVVFVSFPQIETVKAEEEPIYIKADGTVEGTDRIQCDGAVYTLTGGILGKQVIVEKSDIILDGNGTLLGDYQGFEGVITLQNVRNVIIKNCIIKDCIYGIELDSSSHISILGNKLSEADISMYWLAAAIYIKYETSNISIIGNDITSNKWGIINCLEESPDLVVHHNNFVENYEEDVAMCGFSATWDDGKEGNYWSKYSGVDSDGDGIGDTPYIIDEDNQDNCPFIVPIIFFETETLEGETYKVNVVSNSTVSDFVFDPEDTQIQFDVEGERWTSGFCRVTIPKELLYAETEWVVLVDDSPVTPSVDENENNTYLYFTYSYPSYYSHSTKTVKIIGTDAIPEFPSWAPLLFLFAVSIVALTVYKRKLHTHRNLENLK
jgi:parallel beta-helix repeat protein